MPTTLIPMSRLGRAVARVRHRHLRHRHAIDRLLNAPEKLLFASTDLDEVRSMVGRVMKPHQLTRTAGGERLDARMHYTGLGDLSLSRLRYGATVRIEPGPLESFFLVQMPLCGTAAIESGGQRIDSSPELASVLSPECDTRMCWEAGNDQVMLRISRSLVERTLVGYLGHPLDKPLHFELGFAGATARPGAACCPIWWIAPPNIPTWSSTSWCCRRSSNWPPRSC